MNLNFSLNLLFVISLFNKDCLSENELKACEMISREGYYFEDLFMPNSVDSYKIEPVNLKNFKKDF